MDKIIEVKVGGNYLSKDNKNAGVRGEANATKLRITFDEGWDSFVKKITFWDAHGANPVRLMLTTHYLENIVKSNRIYLVPIPAEPMAEAGMLTFVIEGYIDGKRRRSMSDELVVKDAPIADNAGEPADPTPTQAEQLQEQIEEIIGDINDFANAFKAYETGDIIYLDDVSPLEHIVNVRLTEETGINPTEITVTGTGKNLFGLEGRTIKDFGDADETAARTLTGDGIYVGVSIDNSYNAANGYIEHESNTVLNKFMIGSQFSGWGVGVDIRVLPNTTYAVSGNLPDMGRVSVLQYDKEGVYLGTTHCDSQEGNNTFTTLESAAWIVAVLNFDGISGTAYFSDIQIELGSVTEYDPYQVQSCALLEDGSCKMMSISSKMWLATNVVGAVIESEYNWDVDKAIRKAKMKNADWAQADNAQSDYIKNKPPINSGKGEAAITEGEGSKAVSDNTHAEGANTIAGGKGFKITEVSDATTNEDGTVTGIYTLTSVDGLETGMTCYFVCLKDATYNVGQIVYIDGLNVMVNNYRRIEVDTYVDDLSNYSVENYLIVIGRPDLGDMEVGFNAHAEGEDCIAQNRDAHTEGRQNKSIGQYSHAEGMQNTAGFYSHAEGRGNTALGGASHAEGADTMALGTTSHTEGATTKALGTSSHAEGEGTTAEMPRAHAEGYKTIAAGENAHAEGAGTKATGNTSHAEGAGTEASGYQSHAEGRLTKAKGYYAHAEGLETEAAGLHSHAEGNNTKAIGRSSHTEGETTQATQLGAHAEGGNTEANGTYSHAEGYHTKATGNTSHAEGAGTEASGYRSHAEGNGAIASATNSHAEGNNTKASGGHSHAEGNSTEALGTSSHAEGWGTEASEMASHSEGNNTKAMAGFSHSEGNETTAENLCAHAEGDHSHATGTSSHAEGAYTTAAGQAAHSEGEATQANAIRSHAEGYGTIATGECQHVQGRYNIESTKYAHILGNGGSKTNRSNAHTVDWKGNAWYAGTVETTGIILASPNGTRYKVTVDDNGTLITSAI